jgi:hypothetical protein
VVALAAVVAASVIAGIRFLTNSSGDQASSPTATGLDSTQSAPVTKTDRNGADFPDLGGLTDVSADHAVSGRYPQSVFTSPSGLQCSMWSNRGGTAASCFGTIPGLDHRAQHAYVDDYSSYFDDKAPSSAPKLDGKPLASGEKIVMGSHGELMGGDQITCGVAGFTLACVLIRDFQDAPSDDETRRHGFVISPEESWTF